MTNIDLEELRSRLRTVHESQGISKSTSMKLMQEIDETNAKWRKEWGRANKNVSALLEIQELHREAPPVKVRVDGDGNPVYMVPYCVECGWENVNRWPCPTRIIVDNILEK